MRIVKFRGKRIDNDKWVYGYYVAFSLPQDYPRFKVEHRIYTHLDEADCSVSFVVDPETVGQFTGLKDKKKELTEIYEGDIIGVDGLLKGNQYENPNLLQEKTNLLIPAITSKDWQKAYAEAMERGCKHTE